MTLLRYQFLKVMELGFWERVRSNPWIQGFILYSIFRAFYGAGILLVTWFLATETENPWWVSVLFLFASMVFSRVLFRQIKQRRKSESSGE
mgnify:CR=1 FL=1